MNEEGLFAYHASLESSIDNYEHSNGSLSLVTSSEAESVVSYDRLLSGGFKLNSYRGEGSKFHFMASLALSYSKPIQALREKSGISGS